MPWWNEVCKKPLERRGRIKAISNKIVEIFADHHKKQDPRKPKIKMKI